MAEKAEEAASQNILCPLCLDVFDNASILMCGHTFCKQCLERYDAAHRDLDHMVCPLCMKVTKLDESRVAGLPANFTVKALVDEYHSSRLTKKPNESGSDEDMSLHRQVDAICKRDFENSDSDSIRSRPGSSRSSSSKGKSPKNSGPSKSEHKVMDKKKGGESASSTQGHRKKRAEPSSQKDDVTLTEYNSLPCASPTCCRPIDSTVTWIQCDDCDDWYHVTCAGCDYNEVKRVDYQFKCGCKPRKLKK